MANMLPPLLICPQNNILTFTKLYRKEKGAIGALERFSPLKPIPLFPCHFPSDLDAVPYLGFPQYLCTT